MQRIPSLYILESEGRGRGVFTSDQIPEGSIIEICPVIVIPEQQVEQIHNSVLHDYYFNWEINGKKESAIALGYGSIYNHSSKSNADYKMDYEGNSIIIFALKDIPKGQEICISYTHIGKSDDNLWFKPI